MKNDELDALTAMAEDLSQSMDRLLLDGDGNFIRANEVVLSNGVRERKSVPASEVLRMLTQAERKARELHTKLMNLPRRKVAAKAGGGVQQG